jgi:hypothetical protein
MPIDHDDPLALKRRSQATGEIASANSASPPRSGGTIRMRAAERRRRRLDLPRQPG